MVGDRGRNRLIQLVKEFRLKEASEVLIAGATDQTGSREYNLGLSERRAQSALAVLVEAGLDERSIMTEAWADLKPVPTPPGISVQEADAMQRRIEIHALLPLRADQQKLHSIQDASQRVADNRKDEC